MNINYSRDALRHLKRIPEFVSITQIASAISYPYHYRMLIPLLKALVSQGKIEYLPGIGYAGNPKASTYKRPKCDFWRYLHPSH